MPLESRGSASDTFLDASVSTYMSLNALRKSGECE